MMKKCMKMILILGMIFASPLSFAAPTVDLTLKQVNQAISIATKRPSGKGFYYDVALIIRMRTDIDIDDSSRRITYEPGAEELIPARPVETVRRSGRRLLPVAGAAEGDAAAAATFSSMGNYGF